MMHGIRDLLGRVLMVAPPDGWIDGPQDWLDELQPAGVILFKRNLPADLETARAGIARLRAWATARGETLLVAMDEEGGFVTQTNQWMPTPPSARALAWAAEPPATTTAFTAYGRRLRALGMDLDFAPVCDVNNNPQNPVIGVRSFGSDPDLVRGYAAAVHAGLSRAGVLSCAKHFPGHGDTDLDSHLALPVVQHDRARFEAVELVPFRALLPQVPVVMVAHLACPKLGEGDLPATLSRRICTGLLRDELGFRGVAVTDAMDMQGVAGVFGVEEAAVRALLAGCDLLLYCFEIDKPRRARAGLAAALDAGRLPRARLEEAAARVDRLRALAAAVADSPAAEPATPPDSDALLYREMCSRALRLENPDGWRALARRALECRRLLLAGWQEDVLVRLAQHLRGPDLEVETLAPEAVAAKLDAPLVVVLAERKPLSPERVEALRRLPLHEPGTALANVLTPEIDVALGGAYTSILRSADHSDTMLRVIAARLRALGND